jgi:hypothetical protein
VIGWESAAQALCLIAGFVVGLRFSSVCLDVVDPPVDQR